MVKIFYKDEVLKQLKRIGPAELKKAKKKIFVLVDNPLAGKLLKGELMEKRSVRAWPLRIIYIFDSKNQTVLIETIDYRGHVYKK